MNTNANANAKTMTKPNVTALMMMMMPSADVELQAHQREARCRAMGQTSRVLAEVYAARERQIYERGFDAAHDDAHQYGELGDAAMCLLAAGSGGSGSAGRAGAAQTDGDADVSGISWPWDYELWEKLAAQSKREAFLAAIALLVAEVERMDRLPQPLLRLKEAA